MSARRKGLRTAVYCWAALAPLFVLVLLPYAVMLTTALKPSVEIFAFPPQVLPQHVAWGTFARMWGKTDFGQALLNSLLVSLGSTIVTLAAAIPTAYAMTRYTLPAKGALRNILLLSQMMSPVVLIIGLFRLMAMLNLIDSLWSVILTMAGFSVAFAVWMLQSYFATIPRDVEEAARVDGVGLLASLWYVFLPLALPAIGVTAIFAFIGAWTDFILAFTFLRSQGQLTATMKVFYLVSGSYHVEWNDVMAASLVTTLPVAIVFVLVQRQIVGGLSAGAVK